MYGKYLDKQKEEVEAFRRDENLRIPDDLDFRSIGVLSNEEREKLTRFRPSTLGQASRISGVTPAAMFALHAAIKRKQFTRLQNANQSKKEATIA